MKLFFLKEVRFGELLRVETQIIHARSAFVTDITVLFPR